MTANARTALYSPGLLALAVELANYPIDENAAFRGEAHSRTCGSHVDLSCSLEMNDVGLKVAACAIGQASAAIFARHCEGKSGPELEIALGNIQSWLDGTGAQPDWPDIQLIEAARDYPGRHGAIVLPWKAALDALSKGSAAR